MQNFRSRMPQPDRELRELEVSTSPHLLDGAFLPSQIPSLDSWQPDHSPQAIFAWVAEKMIRKKSCLPYSE